MDKQITCENILTQTEVDNNDMNNSSHVFKYNLNSLKTKKNIHEGALRGHYTRENKKTCINLTFSDGAFTTAVLSAVNDLKHGPKHFVIGKEDVERVSIESRKEMSGKYVDTKLEFRVSKEKIVLHVYNTKQKITVQGKKFKWFVDLYWEPFLILRIKNNIEEIEDINKKILNKLETHETISNHEERNTTCLDEEADCISCDRCDFTTDNANVLRNHIIDKHTVNLFRGVSFLLETEVSSQSEDIQEITITTEVTEFKCTKCSDVFSEQESFDTHMRLHEQGENLALALRVCRVCSTKVDENELSIQCCKCIHFFHNSCTAVKESRGKWKISNWICHLCFNLEQTSIESISTGTRLKLPALSGRQRKSNLSAENVEKEFFNHNLTHLKVLLLKTMRRFGS